MGKIKALSAEVSDLIVEGFYYEEIVKMTGASMEFVSTVGKMMDDEVEADIMAEEARRNS
jgi:uncharacterized protein YerC